jgi:hypothetical protein
MKVLHKPSLEEVSDVTVANFAKTKEMILAKTRAFRAASDRNESSNK